MDKVISFRVNEDQHKQLVNRANGKQLSVYIRDLIVNNCIQDVNTCKQSNTLVSRIHCKLLQIFGNKLKSIENDRLQQQLIENNLKLQKTALIDRIVQIIRDEAVYICMECSCDYKTMVDVCTDKMHPAVGDGEYCVYGNFDTEEIIKRIESLKDQNSS